MTLPLVDKSAGHSRPPWRAVMVWRALRGCGRSRAPAGTDRHLPGPQAGDRAWPLRRARLARFPSSRHPVHRRLRIPDLRAGDDSPLSTTFLRDVRETCHFRRLPTPRSRRSGRNATSPNSIATLHSDAPLRNGGRHRPDATALPTKFMTQ